MTGWLYNQVEQELRASAVPFNIKSGTKHHKVFIDGVMVMVFSKGPNRGKDLDLLKSAIKRYQRTTETLH